MLGVNHELQMGDLLLEKGELPLKILATGKERKHERKRFANASYAVIVSLFVLLCFYSCAARFSSLATLPLGILWERRPGPHMPHKTH